MLCYAWNRLEEKEPMRVSIEDTTTLVDLLAKVLLTATQRIFQRGIDRHYREHEDIVVGIKGKVQWADTLKRNLLQHQKTTCLFDEFTSNVLLNQIVVSTLHRLSRTHGLDPDLKHDLQKLRQKWGDIDVIPLQNHHFSQIRLTRNNRVYGFALDVCRLIFEHSFPSEEAGRYAFSDFRRDESKMRELFEAFVRNFYRIEQRTFPVVKKELISWQFRLADESNRRFLPRMETDITLENNDRKIIIDTKYYKNTLVSRFEQQKIHSSNLYQLFSYLLNQEDGTEKTMTARGILLYPTVEEELNLVYEFGEHILEIKTVNLNSDWTIISARLKDILP